MFAKRALKNPSIPLKRTFKDLMNWFAAELVINRALWSVIQIAFPDVCASAPDSPAQDSKPAPAAAAAADAPRQRTASRLGRNETSAALPFIPPRPRSGNARSSTTTSSAASPASNSTRNFMTINGYTQHPRRTRIVSRRQQPRTTNIILDDEPVGSLVEAIRSLDLGNRVQNSTTTIEDSSPEASRNEVEVIDLTRDQISDNDEEADRFYERANREAGANGTRHLLRRHPHTNTRTGVRVRFVEPSNREESRESAINSSVSGRLRTVVSGLFYGGASSVQRGPEHDHE